MRNKTQFFMTLAALACSLQGIALHEAHARLLAEGVKNGKNRKRARTFSGVARAKRAAKKARNK
jgi:hypothetical protein